MKLLMMFFNNYLCERIAAIQHVARRQTEWDKRSFADWTTQISSVTGPVCIMRSLAHSENGAMHTANSENAARLLWWAIDGRSKPNDREYCRSDRDLLSGGWGFRPGQGVAFWAANFAISRTPIAAEYRAALSISYLPMLVESLVGGLIIGFCVSYSLLRFFDRIPTKTPILKSVILSLIVLIIVTILIGGLSSYLATSDVLRYFLIGTVFNVLRFLALGIGIGYVYRLLYKGFDPSANASRSAQAE